MKVFFTHWWVGSVAQQLRGCSRDTQPTLHIRACHVYVCVCVYNGSIVPCICERTTISAMLIIIKSPKSRWRLTLVNLFFLYVLFLALLRRQHILWLHGSLCSVWQIIAAVRAMNCHRELELLFVPLITRSKPLTHVRTIVRTHRSCFLARHTGFNILLAIRQSHSAPWIPERHHQMVDVWFSRNILAHSLRGYNLLVHPLEFHHSFAGISGTWAHSFLIWFVYAVTNTTEQAA